MLFKKSQRTTWRLISLLKDLVSGLWLGAEPIPVMVSKWTDSYRIVKKSKTKDLSMKNYAPRTRKKIWLFCDCFQLVVQLLSLRESTYNDKNNSSSSRFHCLPTVVLLLHLLVSKKIFLKDLHRPLNHRGMPKG